MNRQSRVLIIDDDPIFRSCLAASLKRSYFISVAQTGAEGFRKAESFPPDVVLVDLLMPGWGGERTVRVFRNDSRLADIPLIMLTSDAARASVVACVEAGIDGYILKTNLDFAKLSDRLAADIKNGRRKLRRPSADPAASN